MILSKLYICNVFWLTKSSGSLNKKTYQNRIISNPHFFILFLMITSYLRLYFNNFFSRSCFYWFFSQLFHNFPWKTIFDLITKKSWSFFLVLARTFFSSFFNRFNHFLCLNFITLFSLLTFIPISTQKIFSLVYSIFFSSVSNHFFTGFL